MDTKKEISEVDFDWADSNTLILDSDGKTTKAGTVVLINYNHIIFLSPLTLDQLEAFKRAVTNAVDHELLKRQNN